MDLAPGIVIAERYCIERKIGTGGMAEVWEGRHLAVGSRVAIKRLLPAKALNPEVVARFKREAFFLGRVASDHVAKILDFVTDPEHGVVLVMEFIEGEALSTVVRPRNLAVEEAVDVGADLASALVDLHRASIVHRDLKPANVILRPLVAGGHRAVVVDFGVSRLMRDGPGHSAKRGEDTMTRLTRSHTALGTVEYMSPEQVLNSRDATERSDLYALGAILYRSVAGHHVFGRLSGGVLARAKLKMKAPALRSGRSDVLARGFEALVASTLQRLPADRPQSAVAVLAELLRLREMARGGRADTARTPSEDTRRMSAGELLGAVDEIAAAAGATEGEGALGVAPALSPRLPALLEIADDSTDETTVEHVSPIFQARASAEPPLAVRATAEAAHATPPPGPPIAPVRGARSPKLTAVLVGAAAAAAAIVALSVGDRRPVAEGVPPVTRQSAPVVVAAPEVSMAPPAQAIAEIAPPAAAPPPPAVSTRPPKPKLTGRLSDLAAPSTSAAVGSDVRPPSTASAGPRATATPAATTRAADDVYE